MSLPLPDHKHYASAQKRLLEAALAEFFAENFPKLFGPAMRLRIAGQLLELIAKQTPPASQLQPGQCLWNAVAIDTRADSSKLRLVPVILTLVNGEDISRLASGASLEEVRETAVARLLEEAYQQGGLLSMRDIGLLTWRRWHSIGCYRRNWEKAHGRQLPHPGTLQDMGSCISHKLAIVVKAVYQHQDPRQVASQTRHSQAAVDRYLKDFQRVRTCYRQNQDVEFVSQVTGMSKHLVRQYITIIDEHENITLTGNFA